MIFWDLLIAFMILIIPWVFYAALGVLAAYIITKLEGD